MTTDPDALELVRDAFGRVDEKDWDYLFANLLNDSGHGQFWKSVMWDVRAALSVTTPPAEARREVATRCRSMIETYTPFHTMELSKLLKDAADMLEE